MIGTKLFP